MRYLIRRHPLRQTISPPHLIAPTCFPPSFPPHRVARRVESKPDAIRFATRLAYPPCLLAIISLIAPSHRLIRSARCFPALSAARRRLPAFLTCGSSISSAPPHLICSSLVPPRFPLCFTPSVPPRLAPPNFSPCFQHVACQSHPPRPSHPSHSSHRLIANAPSDKTSDEQAKRRT